MKITWDERKRLSNLEKHGLDFEELEHFDWSACDYTKAAPSAYGRARVKAVGYLRDMLVTVIISFLGSEGMSIISLRPSNAKERQLYRWSRPTQH